MRKERIRSNQEVVTQQPRLPFLAGEIGFELASILDSRNLAGVFFRISWKDIRTKVHVGDFFMEGVYWLQEYPPMLALF